MENWEQQHRALGRDRRSEVSVSGCCLHTALLSSSSGGKETPGPFTTLPIPTRLSHPLHQPKAQHGHGSQIQEQAYKDLLPRLLPS